MSPERELFPILRWRDFHKGGPTTETTLFLAACTDCQLQALSNQCEIANLTNSNSTNSEPQLSIHHNTNPGEASEPDHTQRNLDRAKLEHTSASLGLTFTMRNNEAIAPSAWIFSNQLGITPQSPTWSGRRG